MTIPDDRLITIRDLFDLKFVGDPQLSPDGTQVAFVVTTIDADADEYRSRIWLVPADGSVPPRPLTSGEKADTAPRWSPDGTRIAFLSTRGGKPQLYVLAIDGGEARKVTDQPEGAGEAAWSPDGARLAFAAAVKAKAEEENGDADKKKADDAKEPLRIERLKYKFDGRGYIHGKPSLEKWRHLFVVALPADPDAPLAEATQLTSGDWDDDGLAWSPDGSTLAFTSYREPDADLVMRSDLWTIPAAGGEPRKLTASNGSASTPSWSPGTPEGGCGTTLAYFFSEEADRPFATSRLWTIGADGEQEPRAVAPAFDRDANSGPMADQTLPGGPNRLIWSSDAKAITYLVGDGGNQHLWRMSADGNEQARLVGGERGIVAVSAGRPGGPIVFCATDGASPAELFIADADGGNERQLTDLNRAWLDRKAVSAPERLSVTVGDGDTVDAWLVRPHNVPEGKKYPLVLMIHGGPHGQYGNAFFHEFQFLAARGYGVLYANPHGSSGRGAAFAKALAGRWGEVDTPDLMAAIDHVVATGEADPERLGVGGGSYGGYMTNWLIGHTDRFKAAVTMRSISNLLNFWGTSDIFHLGNVPEFGTPWQHIDHYVKFSPIMYAANFVTPTLILHQEEDYRCPVEQGEQLFTALKLRGIPTRFVRFPGESHGMSRNGKPQHRQQRLEEIVAWYDRYLAG